MRTLPFLKFRRPELCGLLLASGCLLFGACTLAEPKTSATAETSTLDKKADPASDSKGAAIAIDPNGPADTVRVFYKDLRNKKFREAIFLTNLKPAVAGLTDTELKDFSVDFEALAGQVPAEVKINGEIITGEKATVTADLPKNDDDSKNETQTINLQKEGDIWVIQLVSGEAEGLMRKEGKNYFYALRISTHEDEARKMLERISKAELAHSLQNGGTFADMETLVAAGLLPDDIRSSESTGYNYSIDVVPDKIKYSAVATPAVYGKSGKLSFALVLDQKGLPHMISKDNGGKPLSR
jgi:hypothetical protein